MIRKAGAIIYRKVNSVTEYLLVRKLHSLGGHWEFPKGKCEGTEPLMNAALREVKEETGLTITIIPDHELHYSYDYKAGHADVTLFIAKTFDQRVTIDIKELIDYRWLKYEDAMKKLTFENIKEILTKAKNIIEQK